MGSMSVLQTASCASSCQTACFSEWVGVVAQDLDSSEANRYRAVWIASSLMAGMVNCGQGVSGTAFLILIDFEELNEQEDSARPGSQGHSHLAQSKPPHLLSRHMMAATWPFSHDPWQSQYGQSCFCKSSGCQLDCWVRIVWEGFEIDLGCKTLLGQRCLSGTLLLLSWGRYNEKHCFGSYLQ